MQAFVASILKNNKYMHMIMQLFCLYYGNYFPLPSSGTCFQFPKIFAALELPGGTPTTC